MLTTEISARWRPARRASARAVVTKWKPVPVQDRQQRSGWRVAAVADRGSSQAWADVPAQDRYVDSGWQWGRVADASTASAFDAVPEKDSAVAVAWDHSIKPTQSSVAITYNPAPAAKEAWVSPRHQRSDELGPRYDAALEVERSLYVPTSVVAFNFGGDRYTPSTSPTVFFDFRYVPPSRIIQPVDSGVSVGIQPARQVTLSQRLLWGKARPLDPVPTGIEYPDYDGPITIIVPDPDEPDILETYMIANSVSFVVLPDRTPLDATSIRINRDIDSFAWTLSASLFGRTSLQQVRPDSSGPKQVEVEINGHVWLFLIERYSGTGSLADERFTITGVSRTQLLAEPYAPKKSQVNTVPINAEQAAIFELSSIGFELEWDVTSAGPPDWTLPAGAFSYTEQTPMQVVAKLAETVGGIVRPDKAADVLSILPRYREPVWQWSSAVMDCIIPAAIIGQWGGEWQPQTEWNSCYVSGTTHGVAMKVRRAGTAGELEAPDVYEDWLTGEQANRARGIAELCKGGDQEIVSLNLPLFPQATAPGLVEPGMLCEVRDIDETWRGLCLSTEITAEGVGAARVSQMLKLERHHREGA